MTKNILESLVLIAIAAAFAMMMTWPKYQEFEAKSTLVAGKQADLETRLEYFKSLEQTAAELKNYGPNLAKIESALPEQPKAATLVNYLESASMQAGLVMKAIDYSAAAQSAPTGIPLKQNQPVQRALKQFSVTFTLSGPYQSWKNFLASVEKTSRMLEIETMQITAGDQTKVGTAAMPTSQQTGNLDYVVKLTANSY